ncbi:MAG TPA: Eco57I restriction-modification methylase domain-containing protein [Pelagibacterium sp.]|uniref:Eco57I restriction-modification methylase domain-containing protein n=1 Tax=Pelagibacterium sp. TaxID=1967288 RepID=UPI002BAB6F63|nr:Eco57I restriction-modification methylase domain-containing protein [Pelagibacterium sp.]HWJ88721.1 Eco57I restriction-modification methylase domain-containing protein [Pelagibacterium sp.]
MDSFALAIADRQPSLFETSPISEAVQALANAGIEERGAIFTRREVVDFILDLAGYTPDRPLHRMKLLEPSFGNGDFLLPAIERLLSAWTLADRPDPIANLSHAIRGVELHDATYRTTKERIESLLVSAGIPNETASALTDMWLLHADFLLADLPDGFDVVVGNPPYVRQELIPDVLMAEYRFRYRTIYDRADIYVPFIERSLTMLKQDGALGFICADRWMKNRYGAPLRELVASRFHLAVYVDMVDTPAFHSDVIAYPAITIIRREEAGPTRIARRPAIEADTLSVLARALNAPLVPSAAPSVREVHRVMDGREPWILDAPDQLALVRRFERGLPTLEEAGCKVGIGVATGADKAFIAPFDTLDVEPDRKLPLVMTRDIMQGVVDWRGYGVVNPFSDDGGLVDLDKYPRLRRYLEEHKEQIAGRHVARKAPANWYRTIDRIYPAIAGKKKLLIPDIKGEAHIVYEDGQLYPHHNLYYITSETWDIRALQAVLLSGIARLFIATYSTKMRGGYLRFQAQYLRRIRIPHWRDVPVAIRHELIGAAERGDIEACNRAAMHLYDIDESERTAWGGISGHGT